MNPRRARRASTVLAVFGFLVACAAESAMANTRPARRTSERSGSVRSSRSATTPRPAPRSASSGSRRPSSRATATRTTPKASRREPARTPQVTRREPSRTPQVTRREPSRTPQVTRREPSRTHVSQRSPQERRPVGRPSAQPSIRSGPNRTPSSSCVAPSRTTVRPSRPAITGVPSRYTPGGPTVIHRTTHHKKTIHVRRDHRSSWACRPPAPRTIVSTSRIGAPAYRPTVTCVSPTPVQGYYGSTYDRLYGPQFHDAFLRPYPSSLVVTQPPQQVLQPIYVPVETTPIMDVATEPMLETSPYPVLDLHGEPGIPVNSTPLPMPEELDAPASHVPPLTDLPPNAPATFLEQGEEAFAMGRYDEARRLIRRAVIGLPDDPYAQLDYALVHFALGDYQISAQAFRRALVEEPDLLDRMPNVATAYGVPGDFDRHLSALQAQVFREPTDTHARFLYGVVLVSSGDPASAVSHLSRVLHQDPRDTVAYLLRDAALRALYTEPLGVNDLTVPEAP